MNSLARQTLIGFLALIAVLAAALFGPAWTFNYWQGWVYLVVFVGCAAAITLYLARNDPALLQRRVQAGPTAETERAQQLIQALASLAFIGIFVVASLDHRFNWSDVPVVVVLIGDALVVVGFLAVYFVFRENTYTSATIEVAAEQRVISTGPYAIVRHPMYAGALVLLFGTALALGSWWSLAAVALLAAVIVLRLLDEERLLSQQLSGYHEYRACVRHRLVPRVW